MLDAITFQFVSIGYAEDLVAGKFSCDDLADDVLVRESDDEAVLRSIVLVLRLSDETLSGVVICLALAATFVLCLIAAGRSCQR